MSSHGTLPHGGSPATVIVFKSLDRSWTREQAKAKGPPLDQARTQ